MTTATLPWRTDVSAIPVDKPVLVRLKDQSEPTPFMAVRNSDFEPDSVSYLLGPTTSAYGVYVDIADLDAWLEVT